MNAFLKLENLGKETNFDDIRKQKLQQILNCESKTIDQITFIDNFIKHYCSTIIAQFKAVLSSENYEQLLSTTKYFKFTEQQMVIENKQLINLNLYFIISGKFELEIGQKKEEFNKGQAIIILDDNNQEVILKCLQQGELLSIDRQTYKQMIVNAQSHQNQWKLKCLGKTFQKFKFADNKEILLSYFKSTGKLNFGYILTTPTSGSKDLFITGSGKILVFTPNRFNAQYKKSFLILNIFKENNTFNESQLLYDHDEFYGTMVVENNTELLQLNKQNIPQVTDQDTLDLLRDSCSSKERLYKQMIDKMSKFLPEGLEKQQQQLAQAFGLNLNQIEESFEKHFKNGTIYTTEALTMKEKHLQEFYSKVGKNQLEYKGRGEIDNEKKEELIFGTNRIVARELSNVKGMTATQQLALRNLQTMGKSRRTGNLDKDSPLKDLSQMEVQKSKNNMLNAVREEEEMQQKEQQYTFMKKEIGERKLHSLKSDEKNKIIDEQQKQKVINSSEKVILISNTKMDAIEQKLTNDNKPKGNSASKARQKLLLNL